MRSDSGYSNGLPLEDSELQENGEEGQYLAILQTETLGILGWVSRYRVDTYRSTMEEIEGGTRLRSLSFEEDVKIGSKLEKRVTQFDYQKQKVVNPEVAERRIGAKNRRRDPSREDLR